MPVVSVLFNEAGKPETYLIRCINRQCGRLIEAKVKPLLSSACPFREKCQAEQRLSTPGRAKQHCRGTCEHAPAEHFVKLLNPKCEAYAARPD